MVIYKATNIINNKLYIGKTIYTMDIRKKKHLSSVNTKKKLNYHFYNAIRKYGKENFKWEVIDVANTEQELNEKEKYWIKELNAVSPNGYNLTSGGDGCSGYKHTEESKKKISLNNYWLGKEGVNKGKKFSDEHKKKLSDLHKGKPNNIVYTQELINTLRQQKLGNKNPMYGKIPISAKKVIDMNTKEIYNSLHDAGKITGVNWTNIGDVCRGNRISAGGRDWNYIDINGNIDEKILKRKIRHKKIYKAKMTEKGKILSSYVIKKQVINLNTLVIYPSIADAERLCNCSNISLVCRGERNISGGYYWMYLEDYNKLNNPIELKEYKRNPINKRKVICINTNTVYDSLSDAGEKTNTSFKNISLVCLNKRKSAGKHPITNEPLKWQYYDEYIKSNPIPLETAI